LIIIVDCKCHSLPEALYFEDFPAHEGQNLLLIEANYDQWKNLYRCEVCDQLWIINEWDKFVTQFAVKVDIDSCWKEKNTTNLEKKLLLQSRGGTTDEDCICEGCISPRVKGVAYCLDHLYALGTRK
jgi:hypothetical protein